MSLSLTTGAGTIHVIFAIKSSSRRGNWQITKTHSEFASATKSRGEGYKSTAPGTHLMSAASARRHLKTRRRVVATARNSTKGIMCASWMAVARRGSVQTRMVIRLTHSSCSIARKSNFRQHLQGHNACHPNVELESHWVWRDHPRPKRNEGKRKPSKKRVTTKVLDLPTASLKLEAHEECYEPIQVLQLYKIGAFVIHSTCLDMADDSRHRANIESLPDALPCQRSLILWASSC
jgi:hypothetical protein